MLSLTIKDTKNFMSQLLIKEAFDGLFLSEAVIKTANSYTISGELNKDFFSEEEWNELPEKSYSRWSSVKPFCFQLIKGSKVPSYMKMVFLLPPKQVAKLLSDNQTALTPDDINGLFLNIKYQMAHRPQSQEYAPSPRDTAPGTEWPPRRPYRSNRAQCSQQARRLLNSRQDRGFRRHQ